MSRNRNSDPIQMKCNQRRPNVVIITIRRYRSSEEISSVSGKAIQSQTDLPMRGPAGRFRLFPGTPIPGTGSGAGLPGVRGAFRVGDVSVRGGVRLPGMLVQLRHLPFPWSSNPASRRSHFPWPRATCRVHGHSIARWDRWRPAAIRWRRHPRRSGPDGVPGPSQAASGWTKAGGFHRAYGRQQRRNRGR